MRCNEAFGAWGLLLKTEAAKSDRANCGRQKLREDVAATRCPLPDTEPFKLYSGLMLAACRPFGPCFVSKLTF